MPEPLPRGANFMRAKMLFEIGLHIAGNPDEPYTGNRDMCISVGSASGERFRPSLRLSTGSPILAHSVVRGDLDMAMVNPSALLTQAYRGTGLFSEPLPVRVVANYPSFDRFVILAHERTGITSLAQLREQHKPLSISIREDPTHSTRVGISQILGLYGLSVEEIQSWGGRTQEVGPPGDMRRVDALKRGEIDLMWDEGMTHNDWLDTALANGMRPIQLESDVLRQLSDMGWRPVVMPKGFFPHLPEDHTCLDYSGWPLYCSASLPDDVAYNVVDAIAARADEITWEGDAYTNPGQLGQDTDAAPRDVPLHPGAERWYREHGYH